MTASNENKRPTIAFLGLGAMGARMAARLQAAGYPLVVYNRTAERAQALCDAGAKWANTPLEAAEQAEVVISMVSDDAASKHLWLAAETGAVQGLRPQALAIECSTLTPDWARTLAIHVAARGATLLDAPVVGTRPHAEGGLLTFLVGGPADRLPHVQSLLNTMGQGVYHVGETGAGMTMKLAVNVLFGVQVALLGELIGFLEKSGLSQEKGLDTLMELPVVSPVLQRMVGLLQRDTFPPNFPIALVAKDFRYALAAAKQVDAQTPTVEAVAACYAAAVAQGFGADDISGIVQVVG